MLLSLELSELFRRDLTRLIQEIEAFPDDATLWKTLPGFTNPAGNLVLHLEGNLREYVGRQMGGVDFQRDRPLEFTEVGGSRAELVRRIAEARELVCSVVAVLTPEQRSAMFPEVVLGALTTAGQLLAALYGHLSYHMGQIDTLRRILTQGTAVGFAGFDRPKQIQLVGYDPNWPEVFRLEAERILVALGSRALLIEHTGSTAVPGLAAKPVIDILLIVADSGDEPAWLSALEGAEYVLRIREPDWHQHRMCKGPGAEINLHVFSSGCPEIERILRFRDWLRTSAADRALYQRTKLELASRQWNCIDDYAAAKTEIITQILGRATLQATSSHL